jgi:hypothetical protein
MVSIGLSWNSKLVTTPKLPPPPRSAQKRILVLLRAGHGDPTVGR